MNQCYPHYGKRPVLIYLLAMVPVPVDIETYLGNSNDYVIIALWDEYMVTAS